MENIQEPVSITDVVALSKLRPTPATALVELLALSDSSDSWNSTIGLASSVNHRELLLRHHQLITQEIVAVMGRLTWAALIPAEWRSLSMGARIASIRSIIYQSLNIPKPDAARLAVRLNRRLSAIETSDRQRTLSEGEKERYLKACNSRCQLCGRQFTRPEVSAFLAGKPRSAQSYVTRIDKWKPIHSFAKGWTIDVDHVAPISACGTDEPENFQLTCHYCNSIKRDYTSIFDIAPKIAQAAGSWKMHALRLLATHGCYHCGATVRDSELTVGLCAPEAMATIQNFFVTCYGHDPLSRVRWETTGPAE